MALKLSTDRISFDTIREASCALAVIFALSLVLNAVAQPAHTGNNAQSKGNKQSTTAQDRNKSAAERKFEEGESLRSQGTPESLRLAVKKYEEALLLWRAIGDRSGEATTLSNIGEVYDSFGEKQKALDFLNTEK